MGQLERIQAKRKLRQERIRLRKTLLHAGLQLDFDPEVEGQAEFEHKLRVRLEAEYAEKDPKLLGALLDLLPRWGKTLFRLILTLFTGL